MRTRLARYVRFARSFLSLPILVACSRPDAPTYLSDASALSSPVTAISSANGHAIVEKACLSCHSEEMLQQQRLPKEKWAATVKKMTGWGAVVESSETEALVSYLAANFGPDAGAWTPKEVSAEEAAKALDPEDDGPFANGNADNGKAFFTSTCSGCHGADARGGVGVNLVERPVLYQASKVSAMVRNGRGLMKPIASAGERDIADTLAYLRTLRVP